MTPSSQTDNSDRISFVSYLHYAKATGIYIGNEQQNIDNFISNLKLKKSYSNINRKRDIDTEKISRLLRNAWFTEIQLSNLAKHKEFSQLSIHWAQVYCYYACYLAIRSYFISSNQKINNNHRDTLHAISQEIDRRTDLFIMPFKILCEGNPYDKNEVNFKNVSSTPSYINQLSNLTQGYYEDTYCQFLKTTRQKELDRLNSLWKEKNKKKRINSIAKNANIQKLAATSIFDAIYRLRIRSNYETADAFTIDDISLTEAQEFHEALQKITNGCLLNLEILIQRYLSKSVFQDIIEKFSKKKEIQKSMTNWLVERKKITKSI